MTPDKWPGYNSDEDRRRPDIDALRDVFWGRQQESPTYYPSLYPEFTEHPMPVEPFASVAEADEFHADVARFLKGEAA